MLVPSQDKIAKHEITSLLGCLRDCCTKKAFLFKIINFLKLAIINQTDASDLLPT